MPIKKSYQGHEPVRINKWLAAESVCSRREAEHHIAAGRIRIDGEVVSDPGRKILPGQTLTLALDAQSGGEVESFTAILNKPMGYVSSQPEAGQIPAARLLTRNRLWGPGKPPGTKRSLAPLGRLDQDSRGLLLLSEDGVLAKALIGPQSRLDKEYIVRVRGRITPEKLGVLRVGLSLDGRPLKPAKIDRLDADVLRFTLLEGRNRQIRRMCEAVDLRVEDLERVRIGPLQLGDLPEARWRMIAPAERADLIAKSR